MCSYSSSYSAQYLRLEFIEIILYSSFLLFLYCDDEDLLSVRMMRNEIFTLSNVQTVLVTLSYCNLPRTIHLTTLISYK